MAISGPVQEVTGNTGAVPVANYSVTITAPVAGNSLILCSENSTSGSTVASVSGGGVTWARSVRQISTSGVVVDVWFGHNSSGSGTSITITYTTKSATSIGSCNITEWSGLNNAVADATNSATASSSSPTAGAATNVAANSLMVSIGAWVLNDYSSGPTNSFTRRTQFNDGTIFSEAATLSVSSIAAYSTGWTLTAGIEWTAAIAAFGAPDSVAASVLQKRPLDDDKGGNYYIVTPT